MLHKEEIQLPLDNLDLSKSQAQKLAEHNAERDINEFGYFQNHYDPLLQPVEHKAYNSFVSAYLLDLNQ